MPAPRRPRGRRILAAKLVAEGHSHQEVAATLGVTRQAVTKAVGAVLNYETFEDVRNCRMLANARLDEIARVLREVTGLVPLDGTPLDKKKVGEPSARLAAARTLVDIEKRRAEMFGYYAPKRMEVREPDPLENMTPEELLAACQQLNIRVPPGLIEEVERRQKQT